MLCALGNRNGLPESLLVILFHEILSIGTGVETGVCKEEQPPLAEGSSHHFITTTSLQSWQHSFDFFNNLFE